MKHTAWQGVHKRQCVIHLHDVSILCMQVAQTHRTTGLRTIEATFFDHYDKLLENASTAVARTQPLVVVPVNNKLSTPYCTRKLNSSV